MPVEKDKYSIYDDSIIHTLKNVKNVNVDTIYYSFHTENKYFKPEFKATKEEIINALNIMNMKMEDMFNVSNMQPYYEDEYNLSRLNDILMNEKSKEIFNMISKM